MDRERILFLHIVYQHIMKMAIKFHLMQKELGIIKNDYE